MRLQSTASGSVCVSGPHFYHSTPSHTVKMPCVRRAFKNARVASSNEHRLQLPGEDYDTTAFMSFMLGSAPSITFKVVG